MSDTSNLLANLVQEVGRMNGVLESMNEKQDQIHKAIYGNGRPGLIERVQRIEDCDKDKRGFKRGIREMIATYGSLMASLGALVAIIYHIKHMG